MSSHPDRAMPGQLAGEQAAVSRMYQRLDELRALAGQRLRRVQLEGPSGSPQNRSERDSFATLHSGRLEQLDAVEDRLCFGRLDLASEEEPRYIGRIGLTDQDLNPMLSDWRAPAAEPFYRATAAHPGGVLRRRHLLTKGRDVIGLDDDVLDLAGFTNRFGPGAREEHLAGDGALMAALSEARTGKMTDIVATIQAEQDEVIRAPLGGALVVQGGPGTGKTAAALHRAAYLLYVHRSVLASAGVLLLGPSRIFLRYIDQVLPSLGETGVVATTIADLFPGVEARGTESARAAEIKGRALFARVVRRAVLARERELPAPVRVRLGRTEAVLRPRDVQVALQRARSSGKPHNEARLVFVREALAQAVSRYGEALGSELDPVARAEVMDDLRNEPAIRRALNLAWLPMTPQWLVSDLLAKEQRLAEFAPELSGAERRALLRPRDAAFTPADVPLLDEAAELLGTDPRADAAQARAAAERRAKDVAYARQVLAQSGAAQIVGAEQLADRFAAGEERRSVAEAAASDRLWAYGHIVVDEAQELSEMDWRMVLRRCPRRSLTLTGDTAQSALGGSWADRLDGPLGKDGWRLRTLTVNYRTPAEIMAAATAFAEVSGLVTSPLTSPRSVPGSLTSVQVGQAASALRADGAMAPGQAEASALAGAEQVACEAARLAAGWIAAHPVGVLAVIGAPSDLPGLATELRSAGLEVRSGGTERIDILDARVAALEPGEAKGLEFDMVILAEPASILRETSASALYVALTRATAQAVLVHAAQLPEPLASFARHPAP